MITTKKKAGIKKPITKKSGLKKAKRAATIAESKAIKVQTYPNKGYSEEYQITGFHYAFLSTPEDGSRMCHWWVKCRDFLQDALRNQLTGRNDQIYSFAYRPNEDPPVDTARTRMLVKRVPNPVSTEQIKEFAEMMASGLKLVNYYEKKYKLTPVSKLVAVEQADNPVLFVGPGIWSKGPVMIGLYTFLIRLGYWKHIFTEKEGPEKVFQAIMAMEGIEETNDVRYLRTIHPYIDKMLKHRDLHLFKPSGKKEIRFATTKMSSFHHHSGPVSLASSFCDLSVKQAFNAAK